MSNFETVKAVTLRLQELLKKEGISFSARSFEDDKGLPASLLPLGRISYRGESFESSYGQRPSYNEAEFRVDIVMSEPDPEQTIREQQRWGHLVRSSVTVDGLNGGTLAASKPVSRVAVTRFEAEKRNGLSIVSCRVLIRYRES